MVDVQLIHRGALCSVMWASTLALLLKLSKMELDSEASAAGKPATNGAGKPSNMRKNTGKVPVKKSGPAAFTAVSKSLSAIQHKRILMFEEIRKQQIEELQEIGGAPIKITLPDGSVRNGSKLWTLPLDVAKDISKQLAASALVAEVDDELWDMSRPLQGDCKLKICTFAHEEGRKTFWHSSAHILGQVLENVYNCKLCIRPCTTSTEGFYYDAFYGDKTLKEEDLETIRLEAKRAVQEKQPFERIEVTRNQALEIFSENPFKVEIIEELPESMPITIYRCGPLVDLCKGPHVPNTSVVKAFAPIKASASYWRGKADRESLQRVYGVSYPDHKKLEEYFEAVEEAKKRDHRVLGQDQKLFFFHELSPGSCFFLPAGARIVRRLKKFLRLQYRKRGYQEVITPNIYNMKLWETSGHAANYKENIFVFEIEKQEFGLKPMNCPGHCLMFQQSVRSYRELPIRSADFGVLHRNELSGALTGLTRVRRFEQDDAHIFCMESQVVEEVKGALEFMEYVYSIFGFTFELELSTRPQNRLGDSATWDRAENALEDALNAFNRPWVKNEGDGAFYGPKIDITVSDALKRKFQCATIQLDFQLPERFQLSYSTADEATKERPVMVHRAVLGSVERMFAILLEHYAGKWPFWLSPRQAVVCSVSGKFADYARKVRDIVQEAGFYVDADVSDRKIDKKVREAQLAQYNYILVGGERVEASEQVNVRTQDNKVHGARSITEVLDEFRAEAAAFH